MSGWSIAPVQCALKFDRHSVWSERISSLGRLGLLGPRSGSTRVLLSKLAEEAGLEALDDCWVWARNRAEVLVALVRLDSSVRAARWSAKAGGPHLLVQLDVSDERLARERIDRLVSLVLQDSKTLDKPLR